MPLSPAQRAAGGDETTPEVPTPVHTFASALEAGLIAPDEPFVPRRTYKAISTWQCIRGLPPVQWAEGEKPVVLRGSVHGRIFSRGGHRAWADDLLDRYLRRYKPTCLDPEKWHTEACRIRDVFAKRSSWHRQRAVTGRLFDLVRRWHQWEQWSVLIEGKVHHVGPREYRILVRLQAAGTEIDRAIASATNEACNGAGNPTGKKRGRPRKITQAEC